MMEEMMKKCCGEEGIPDFEKMKQFMESCGKAEFSEEEVATMKKFCTEAMANCEKMKQFMESRGCRCP